MKYQKSLRAVAAFAVSFLLSSAGWAEERVQDHSCTVNVAGEAAVPFGKDGSNFDSGWGIQAGGGFAVTRPVEPRRGAQLYITGNFMYARLDAAGAALAAAKAADPAQLASATSAHGSFYTATLDPTVRIPLTRRIGLYGSGGFGWLRRSVAFNGANPATLLQSSAFTLDRLASNSGVFDLGGGMNFGLTHGGGLMLYGEIRVYRGLTVNSATTLLPLSVGVRW